MRWMLPPLFALAALGCRPEPAQEAPAEAENATEPARPALPDADINASLEPIAADGNQQLDDPQQPPKGDAQ